MGQVWGWGHGGEGQLGLGTRVKMVSSPHIIPCIELPTSAKDRSSVIYQGSKAAAGKVIGNYVKGIACGGRHSIVVTGENIRYPSLFSLKVSYSQSFGFFAINTSSFIVCFTLLIYG